MLKYVTRHGREFAFVFGVIAILGVLFAPIPAVLLDLSILTNFGFSLTILLLTLYVGKPVEFSTFPSLLLISTLLRLSLSVAATRLILTEGDAGEVINSIGTFAVGGNFVVGLVVFLILVVVQYVVVTSGAQRVSEVAARFTLDSMPGQQMSIDADLNMGLIDQKEAVQRRADLEKEASFYGAMDGASKFVKGDAIAGVIILLINIIAGWIIGMMQMGMDWQTALEHFTLLTIGDGISTQLPALIVSIATGIIVTRSAADKELSTEVFRQLSSVPRILLIVTAILSILLLLPGMPKWPIAVLIGATVLVWLRIRKSSSATASAAAENDARPQDAPSRATAYSGISIVLGGALARAWKESDTLFMDRLAGLRETHEKAYGVGFPAIKLVDGPQLADHEYEIRIFGARYAGGDIELGKTLAIKSENSKQKIDGVETVDPAFGLPAVWINDAQKREAREAGFTTVDPLTAFVTHLGEVLRGAASALLTRSTTAKLLDDVRSRQAGLIEELIPNLMSVSDVQRVLQNLLAEGVSIGAMDLIAEHLVDIARGEKDTGALTELLRQRMSQSICDRLKGRNRELAVISLDPRLENQIQSSVAASGKRETLAIDPKLADRVMRRLVTLSAELMRQGREPVLLCGGDIRRQLRALTQRSIPKLSVLSVSEIPMHIELRSHGVVKIDPDDTARKPEMAQAGARDA